MIHKLINRPEFKFLLVGGSVTGLNFILYSGLVEFIRPTFWGMESRTSSQIICWPALVMLSFLLNKSFVWQSTKRKRDTIVQFFVLYVITGLVIQPWVIHYSFFAFDAVPVLKGHLYTCNLLAWCLSVGIGMIANFLGGRYMFKKTGGK
ncbi:MAG: GtrA family protein [Lactobacillaceae bacterium]|jgi:putative flippase GtrA|nr:GtrA family protein [Lactobacillaceae bacterium]